MATIDKHYGAWRARVRKRAISRTKTFPKKSDAALWAAETERAITLSLPLGGDDGATLALILQCYAGEVIPLKKGADKELHRLSVILRHKITQIPLGDLTSTTSSSTVMIALSSLQPEP